MEGRGQNTTNKSRDGYYGCHVTVYRFALSLFGLQIDFIGLLQRIDYCGPSIGCMQPLVLKKNCFCAWASTLNMGLINNG